MIYQSKNANTQYITIPAAVVRDSQYPFKDGGKICLVVDPKKQRILIARTKEIIEAILEKELSEEAE